jgi:hypothetical protein
VLFRSLQLLLSFCSYLSFYLFTLKINKGRSRVMKKYRMVCFLTLCVFSLITACAHLPGKGKNEESLRQRVKQEWDAKMKGDWSAVYDLTTAEFKQKVERDKFIQGATLKVTGYSVKEVRGDTAQGKATVIVTFDLVQSGMTFKGANRTEEWVWQDGEWRLIISPKTTPFGTKEQAAP